MEVLLESPRALEAPAKLQGRIMNATDIEVADETLQCHMEHLPVEGQVLPDYAGSGFCGALKQITSLIVVYRNGVPINSYPPLAVQWALGGAVVKDYRPTTQRATVDKVIDLTQNPVVFFPWLPLPVGVNVLSETATGAWVPETGVCAVVPGVMSLSAGVHGQIGIVQSGDKQILCFGRGGDSVPVGIAFTIVGTLLQAGTLGIIQRVKGSRIFTSKSGQSYTYSDTGGDWYLDAASTDPLPTYMRQPAAARVPTQINFEDSPDQELLSGPDADPFVSFTVEETYSMQAMYSMSESPETDPNNIWVPGMPSLQWGWSATCTQDYNGWALASAEVHGVTLGDLELPVWSKTIR